MVAVISKFDNLTAGYVAVVEGETYEGADFLPTLLSCSSRIDGENTQTAVGDYLENMAVATHKDFGLNKVKA